MDPLNTESVVVVVVNGSTTTKKTAASASSPNASPSQLPMEGLSSSAMKSPPAEVAAAANFRKRRLSLPRHHLEPTTDASSTGTPDEQRHHYQQQQQQQQQQQNQNHHRQSSEDEDSVGKAHTFRKRRLSLPLSTDGEEEEDTNGNATKVQRRLSTAEASVASSVSDVGPVPDERKMAQPLPMMTKPRIQHSVEMIAGPFAPPSPIHHCHVLHQQNPLPPSQISALDDDLLLTTQSLQHHHTYGFSSDDFDASSSFSASPSSPKQYHSPTANNNNRRRNGGGNASRKSKRQLNSSAWKQRHHHVDEDKLPFPKFVVGTYSCHGIEPIYDSDYENEQPPAPVADAQPGQEEDEFSWGTNEEKKHTMASAAAGGKPAGGLYTATNANTPEDTGGFTKPSLSIPQSQQPTVSAKINQDRGGITFPYANSERTALFAVYDGHGQGGELVSQFALHEIQRRLELHPKFATDLETAMRQTFLAVDEALKHEPIIEPFFAGTTACVALLQDQTLTLANAGDSRAVLARRIVGSPSTQEGRCWLSVDLTKDQNPDSPLELERILKAGGYVSPPPGPSLSARVWLDAEMTQIGLAMGRSIGDHAVSTVGVIADPVVTTFDITPGDDFMILASDGVWEFLSSQEAVLIVGKHLPTLGATKACQALIEAAASRWHDEEGEYRDDITAIVVNLETLWEQLNDKSTSTAAKQN